MRARTWVVAHCCTLLLSRSLAKNRGLVIVYWLELEARDIPTGWNLIWGVVQGGSSRIKTMNSERARHPIYLVPAEWCGGWHGCSKFRATPNKVHQVGRYRRNYFFSGREWSTGSPCGLGSVSAWPGGMIRCGTPTTAQLCSLCHGICWSSEFSSAHRCLCQSTGAA